MAEREALNSCSSFWGREMLRSFLKIRFAQKFDFFVSSFSESEVCGAHFTNSRGSCPSLTWMPWIDKLGTSWQLSLATCDQANHKARSPVVRLGEPDDGESLKQVGKDPAREYQARKTIVFLQIAVLIAGIMNPTATPLCHV